MSHNVSAVKACSVLEGTNNIPTLNAQQKADLQEIYDLLNNPVDGLQLDFNQLVQDLQAKPPVDPTNLIFNQILPKLADLHGLVEHAEEDFPISSGGQWYLDNVMQPLDRQFFQLSDGSAGTMGQYLDAHDYSDAARIFQLDISDKSFDAGYASQSLQNLSTYLNSVLNPS